jgi:hypothetical protein
MKIVSFFTNSGTPATGLNPTIRIRDLSDNSLVVTDAVMTEVGDGHYVYDYIAYDLDKNYAIRSDGGGTLPNADRYKYAGNENYIEDIQAGLVIIQSDLKRVLGLMHENIYIDQPVFDGDGNLTSARVRIYSAPGSVGTTSDVIGTYEITAPGDGAGKFTSWKQVRV